MTILKSRGKTGSALYKIRNNPFVLRRLVVEYETGDYNINEMAKRYTIPQKSMWYFLNDVLQIAPKRHSNRRYEIDAEINKIQSNYSEYGIKKLNDLRHEAEFYTKYVLKLDQYDTNRTQIKTRRYSNI